MSNIVYHALRVTTLGSAGAAVGEATSESIEGILLDLFVNYHASAPATTVVTVSHQSPALGNIIAVPAGNTDINLAPTRIPVGPAGVAIVNGFTQYPIAGRIKVAVTLSDALADAVKVTLRYMRL